MPSVQVVKLNEGSRSYELSVGDIDRVLLEESVKDREIVVVSIAGAFRKGKSFMMNFFLRYLHTIYRHENVENNWLGNEEDTLNGFDWKGGSNRVTTGIHMWGELFFHDYQDGRKVVIILMDTQGTFDSKTTINNCTTIFALSNLLSSVQIFNIMQNIQEDDLQHLQLFSEYGRMVAQDGEKPFQELLFLVRDWNFPYEHEYGLGGGQALLDDRLNIYDDQESEHKFLRNHVISCYNQIRCFLMPSPGSKVTTSQNFVGKLSEIEDDFKKNLKVLVPLLLAPENLIVKKINGQAVKAHEFVEFFKEYFDVFKNGNLPPALTMFEATATVHNTNAVREGEKFYATHMRSFCSTFNVQDEKDVRREHNKRKIEAFNIFDSRKPMGLQDYLEPFVKILDDFIEATLLELLVKNRRKPDIMSISLILSALAASTLGPGVAAVGTVATVAAASFMTFLLNIARKR